MGKRLRMGMIGCGGNGRGHLRQLSAHPEVEVVALADPSEKMLALTREAVPALVGTPAFSDYREMLATTALDAVAISTPHTQHFRQVLDCLGAGLHVLCEKPLAVSVAEAKKICAAAKKKRRVVLVSFQRRFQAMRKLVRQLVRDEAFGRVQFVQSFLSQDWLKSQRGTWRQDPALSGGGQINDSGAHIIDMIFWTVPSRAVEVTALIDNRGSLVDIDSAVSFRFENGALGNLSVVGDGPRNIFWEDMTIVGSAGRAIFLRQGVLTVSTGTETLEYKGFGRDEGPDARFVDVVLGRAKNESPPDEVIPAIAFTEACWKSARRGGKVIKITY